MQHRHIYSSDRFSSAAIDDIIGRGSLDDWRKLDFDVRSDGLLIDKILKVHRVSVDHDHTLGDLKPRFDDVLAQLESVAGWKTARVRVSTRWSPWHGSW